MAELKPCPFCGGKAKLRGFSYGGDEPLTFDVICIDCIAQTDEFDTEEKAKAAWERRADNG